MDIFAVTTASGNEIRAADAISEEGGAAVSAVLAPHSLNGYVFVEASSRSEVEAVVNRTPHTKKVVPGETSLNEVSQFLTAKSDVADVAPGDTVIVTGGAYEGKEARIKHVHDSDEKVTVELIDEPIQIPIELPGTQVRPA